jgi:cathepsin L
MRKFLTAIALVATAVAARAPKGAELRASYSYERYVADFKKPPPKDTREAAMRRALVEQRVREAVAHNALRGITWTKGVNHLSDRTEEELRRMRGGRPRSLPRNHPALKGIPVHEFSATPGYVAPTAVDWRGHVPQVLTAVKDQGECGACWAHATVEEVESHYALAKGELFTLSQQQLVGCMPNPTDCGGYGGCAGAMVELAYTYIHQVGGLTQEWNAPYVAYMDLWNSSCPKDTVPYVQIAGYTTVPSNNQTATEHALFERGPLAIYVDASGWAPYAGGVYNGCNYANNITIDHAVQLVGYGYDQGLKMAYWIVRNSYSPAWGEAGYIRLQRDLGEVQCGYNNGTPAGCDGAAVPAYTCGQCGLLADPTFPNILN